MPLTDTWARLPKIDVPVLAIHGVLDAPDSIAMAERVARPVSDVRSVTVQGVGHYPNMEKPQEFNAVLLDFLGDL